MPMKPACVCGPACAAEQDALHPRPRFGSRKDGALDAPAGRAVHADRSKATTHAGAPRRAAALAALQQEHAGRQRIKRRPPWPGPAPVPAEGVPGGSDLRDASPAPQFSIGMLRYTRGKKIIQIIIYRYPGTLRYHVIAF